LCLLALNSSSNKLRVFFICFLRVGPTDVRAWQYQSSVHITRYTSVFIVFGSPDRYPAGPYVNILCAFLVYSLASYMFIDSDFLKNHHVSPPRSILHFTLPSHLLFLYFEILVSYVLSLEQEGGGIFQVCIVTELRAGRPGFDSRQVMKFFSIHHVQAGPGPTQPPVQWVPRALSPGLKRPERESGHSPPYSAKLKNVQGCTSTSPCLHVMVLS